LEGYNDLSKIISKKINIKDIKSFCTNLIKNVKDFHEKDFFHNDIKLENIMVKLDTDGNVEDFKFIDFGLSFFWKSDIPMEELQKKLLLQGTLSYFFPNLIDLNKSPILTPIKDIREEFVKKDLFSIFLVCTYLKNYRKTESLQHQSVQFYKNVKNELKYNFYNYVCALKANRRNNFKSTTSEMFNLSVKYNDIAEILKETMDDKKYGSSSIYADSLSGRIENIQKEMNALKIAFQKTQSKQQNPKPKPEGG